MESGLPVHLYPAGVTANSVHPGIVSTEIMHKEGGPWFLRYFAAWPIWLMGKVFILLLLTVSQITWNYKVLHSLKCGSHGPYMGVCEGSLVLLLLKMNIFLS